MRVILFFVVILLISSSVSAVSEKMPVIVIQKEGKIKSMSRMDDLDVENFDVKHRFSALSGFTGEVTEEGFQDLMRDPSFEVYKDGVRYLSLSYSAPQIRANQVWEKDITGKDQTICLIDTGVDYRHPDLGNCSTEDFLNGVCPKVIGGTDFYNYDDDPMDDQGHGTHIAGILASDNYAYKGVAPDAKIVAVKVCDNSTEGECWISDIVSGIDYCIANKEVFNISVISLSIGGGLYTSFCDDELDAIALNTAVDNGIFAAVAAGNDGSNFAIAAPACASNVAAVGWVDGMDNIALNSNRASFNTILAPGTSIISTVPMSGDIVHASPSGFKALSGTSMAAPHVAGVAALMLQANSSLSPLDIRDIIKRSGMPIDDSGIVYRRVDGLSAIESKSMPTYEEIVERLETLENQDFEERITLLEQWIQLIQDTIDHLKFWLIFHDYQGGVICDVIESECIGGPPPSCSDECNQGAVGCNDGDTRWYCELQPSDGCYDRIMEDCPPAESCLEGVCSLEPGPEEVIFRTSVLNGNYAGCNARDNCWIAIDRDGDCGLNALGFELHGGICNGDVIGTTPEGYQIIDYGSFYRLSICDGNGIEITFSSLRSTAGAELSSEPVEPYTSNGQEVYGDCGN